MGPNGGIVAMDSVKAGKKFLMRLSEQSLDLGELFSKKNAEP
jgi:hypothetical protein